MASLKLLLLSVGCLANSQQCECCVNTWNQHRKKSGVPDNEISFYVKLSGLRGFAQVSMVPKSHCQVCINTPKFSMSLLHRIV